MGFFNRQGRGRAAAGAGTRRKTRILIATLCLCAAAALAQEKPKVALYIANESLKPDEKSFLTNKLLKPFTQSGLYNVIDRSDIFTQKAAAERIKQRDGSVNDKEIYKIGYEAGAKYVCMVELNHAFGRWQIAARLVDVVTAEIYLAQGETDIKGELIDADFSGAAKTVFEQIHSGKPVGAATQTQPKPASAPASAPPQPAVVAPKPKPQPPAPVYQPTSVDSSGILTDGRDGRKYRTVMIGGNRWMAENLNHRPKAGRYWCYKDDCNKYGRLYNWNTADTICPEGFHLPSRDEFDKLGLAVGGKSKYNKKSGYFEWLGAGEKLKARSGWKENSNGTDDFGFSAQPTCTRFSGVPGDIYGTYPFNSA